MLGRVDAIMVTPTARGLAALGDAPHAQQGAEVVLSWPSAPALLWAPHARALLWSDLEALASPAFVEGAPRGPAADVWKRWTRGRAPLLEVDLELDVAGARARKIGPVGRLDYRSSKFNRRGHEVSYRHEHGEGVDLLRCTILGADLWVLQGGRLRITSRGVEG